MFDKKKKYILDGGSGQTLLEKGLKPEGTLWSATALINKNLHNLIVEMHMDFELLHLGCHQNQCQ